MSRHRAEGPVRIARRAGELPECFALFQAGILRQDAMVRIARRVPADRDMDVAIINVANGRNMMPSSGQTNEVNTASNRPRSRDPVDEQREPRERARHDSEQTTPLTPPCRWS